MLRRLHSLPGLAAALLVAFTAVTGAMLSLQPVLERLAAPQGGGLSVAALADRVMAAIPDVETITRAPSGAVTAHAGGTAIAIDPATGASLGPARPSPVFAFLTELHRSLFLGDGGRIAAGLAAAAMAVLAATGLALLAKRMGGWRRLFATARGSFAQRLHVEVARLAVLGLALSAATGLYMALVTFGYIADGNDGLGFPPLGNGGAPAPVASLAALRQVPLAELRELAMPMPGDPQDVFTLTTASGTGHVDQASGALLDFTANAPMQTLYEAVYTLHTGQGHWWLALLLGMASLAVPVLMVTGTLIWALRRRSRPRIVGDAGWRRADTVILVGSEGNTTWGFAATLHAALVGNGHAVHLAAMNALRPAYPRARRLLVLSATYGDGAAPASARAFLSRLGRFRPGHARFAVLGFGDRKFRTFCGYAEAVDAALEARGMARLADFTGIDRQSAQAFAQWGQRLGAALGAPLDLVHRPDRPDTRRWTLIARRDYGTEVQAPTAVLRFALPVPQGLRQRLARRLGLAGFAPGDLLGILPPGDAIPRYYSIASADRDGVLEICVRRQQGGLCSNMLFGLRPGDAVEAFVRANPDFRPGGGKRPLVLIGAGAGVAPLVGFVRANRRRRPVHLYLGSRDPASDFLYGEELGAELAAGRLTSLATAFSRLLGGRYVQHRLQEDADALRSLAADGARFMVCGSIAMGEGVREALDGVLAPLGLTVEGLRRDGRYAEDVY